MNEMTKNDIKTRVNGLNQYMLSNSNKQLLFLTISNIYTYNKAVALVNKDTKNKDWYSIDDKHCFKTYDEIEAFLSGLCIGKNTDFGNSINANNFYDKEKIEYEK